MAKPKFPFSIKWWSSNKILRTLSASEKGVLLELMLLMMDGDEYGVATRDGLLYTIEAISLKTGLTMEEIKLSLPVLQEKKIIIINKKNALASSYMINDMNIREMRTEIGRKGGNPGLVEEQNEKEYITKKGRSLVDKQLAGFNIFWKTFNYYHGKAEAADAWLDLKITSADMFDKIIKGARKETEARSSLIERGGTPKWAQGWLSSRRFEDYE